MTGNKQGLWIGAAVLVSLLAACGGDSANDGAAQSGAEVKQLKAEQADGNAQAPDRGTDVAASAAAADAAAPVAQGAANEAAGQQEAAKTDTGVTENGIRGEVAADLLVQNNTFRDYDDPTMERTQVMAFSDPGLPLSGPPPEGKPLDASSKAPNVFAHQYTQKKIEDIDGSTDVDGTHQIRLGSQSTLRPEKLQEFPGGYEPLASIMGVTLDESSFAWSSYGAAWFSPASGIREGKLLMRLERRAVVRNIAYQELEDGSWKVPLTSDRTYDVKYGEIIPFDTVLQHWKDAEGNFTELLFLKGRRKGEVRLCTNTAVKGFRRLTCNIWGVNSYAPEDLGTYVVDDRSFHQKGAGLRYWESALPGTNVAEQPAAGQQAAAQGAGAEQSQAAAQ